MELFDKVVDQTLAFMRDYQVDPETGSWVKWDVPSFKYVKNTPFFHLVVPGGGRSVVTARLLLHLINS